jgi:Ca2+-binding RTX toxin-like protein
MRRTMLAAIGALTARRLVAPMLVCAVVIATLLVALATSPARAVGTISLTAIDVAHAENFDTLSASAGTTTNTLLPIGWELTESGGGARDNEAYAVDTGSSNTGDTYSYGATGSPDRAFGTLRSGTLIPIIGASFTNNTGSVVTALDVSYVGEQWRLGTAGRADRLDFQYSLNAASLTVGTWTDTNALDFLSPITAPTVGALDGNAVANRSAIAGTIAGLSIADGGTVWIRWTDLDVPGADDGLAVDEFSLTPRSVGGGTTTTTGSSTTTTTAATTTTSTTTPPAPTCDGRVATIIGTNGANAIYGTPGPDVIVGLGGGDAIYGLGGDDAICGGGGGDVMYGGEGNDRIFGEADSDSLRGENGNDYLAGGSASDQLIGGNDNDSLDGGSDADQCLGDAGTDSAVACESQSGIP